MYSDALIEAIGCRPGVLFDCRSCKQLHASVTLEHGKDLFYPQNRKEDIRALLAPTCCICRLTLPIRTTDRICLIGFRRAWAPTMRRDSMNILPNILRFCSSRNLISCYSYYISRWYNFCCVREDMAFPKILTACLHDLDCPGVAWDANIVTPWQGGLSLILPLQRMSFGTAPLL
jgi:hypothetical protein